ncbi:hypothetical protein LTR36_009657 [Oleoguttula mirabilis]|uniref:Uncharacterized protein n=1 Tax=Oleoguttula mirabilis TaxID=1507867 RepID=A0AAV9J5J9_9PEZI|nr:hypothetical protein LTR36_009657 [Oleoguttula mirabilis]
MSDSDPYVESDDPITISDDDSEAEVEGSSRLTSGSPSPEPVETSLGAAIRSASHAQLVSIMLELCKGSKSNASTSEIVGLRLLTPIKPTPSQPMQGRKRKRLETCKHCHEEYDIITNAKGDCVYHPDEKDVDDESSTWDDHDERCHGDPYSLMDDPTYEDGYRWICCDKRGGEDGCVASRRKPAAVASAAKHSRH